MIGRVNETVMATLGPFVPRFTLAIGPCEMLAVSGDISGEGRKDEARSGKSREGRGGDGTGPRGNGSLFRL